MSWEDRDYHKDDHGGRGAGMPGVLAWLQYGSVPLFTAFGIRVRAHSSMVIFIGLTLIFGLGQGFTVQDRIQSMAVLFGIVLLHEFGHCFAARWVGGEANDIVMHPLGGLAMTRPPHRPGASFITVAGGPMVNVIICVICGAAMWTITGWLPWDPFRFVHHNYPQSWVSIWPYVYWIYATSYRLLIFNLLPIFPLDGGQMLHSILWHFLGYYRAMNISTMIGMIGAVGAFIFGSAYGDLFLPLIAVSGFVICMQMRQTLRAHGPEAFAVQEGYESGFSDHHSHHKLNQRMLKKVRKQEAMEAREQVKIDAILAKVSEHGMHSLSWFEKRTLKKATKRQREAENARR